MACATPQLRYSADAYGRPWSPERSQKLAQAGETEPAHLAPNSQPGALESL